MGATLVGFLRQGSDGSTRDSSSLVRVTPTTLRTVFLRLRELVPILLGIALLASLIKVSLAFVGKDLGYDEAYNLQVVDSLVGVGRYATFGVTRGFGPWDFDPQITTGFPLLLVLTPVWWASSGSLVMVRLLMLLIFVIYVLGLVILSRGATQRLLTVGAMAAPVLLVTPGYFGGALGELPAATLVLWFLIAARAGRLKTAALLIGLAVQTKFLVVVVAVPALFSLVWLGVREYPRPARCSLGLMIMAASPTVLFEFWRLIAFGGLAGYRGSLDELFAFFRYQSNSLADPVVPGGSVAQALNRMLQLLTPSAWLAVLLLSANSLLALLSWRRTAPMSESAESMRVTLITHSAVLAGSLLMATLWAFQSSQGAVRQVTPSVLIGIPALVVIAKSGVSRSQREHLAVWIFAATTLIASAAASTLSSGWRLDVDPFSDEQRQVLSVISQTQPRSIRAVGWWQFPEYQLFARLPATQWIEPTDQIALLDAGLREGGSVTAGEFLKECEEVLLSTSSVVVCRPVVPSYAQLEDLNVVAWGEQDAVLGETSNPQPSGFGGLWVMIEPEDPRALLAMQVLIDGSQIEVGEISTDGTVITALVPPSVYRTPGRHVIELRNAISGQVIPVGEFTL